VLEFCRPPEVATIKRVLERVADLAITPDGGFPQAERQRVFFARAVDYELDQEQERKEREAYFTSVSVEGNFIFDKASHRDFLGALLGTGITREKVRRRREGKGGREGEKVQKIRLSGSHSQLLLIPPAYLHTHT
jgi:RNA-binding protein YlmH